MANVDKENTAVLAERGEKKHHTSIRTARIISNTVIYILLVVMVVIWLTPIAWIVLQSFNAEIGSAGLTRLIPKEWGADNFYDLFWNVYRDARVDGVNHYVASNYVFFWRVTESGQVILGSFFVTLIVAVVAALISSLFVLMTSYAFSRLRFKGRTLMMRIILLMGMFPGFLGLIVLYWFFKILGLEGDKAIWALIITYSGGAGMGYYIMKGFFDTISKQIDEAAMIDGATRAEIFWKITLPLSKPIIVYQILTSFMGPWGEFITARYLLGSPQNYQGDSITTVAVQLQQMITSTTDGLRGHYWGQFFAGAVIVAIPTSILFIMMQRYYVSGVTGGAVKG